MPAPQVQSRKRIRTINLEDEPLDLSPPAKRFPVQQRSSVIFRTPEVQAIEQRSSVSEMQIPSKPVLSVSKLSITPPISSKVETASTDQNSNIATSTSSSSVSPTAVTQKSPIVVLDQIGMPRIQMTEQKNMSSGMQQLLKRVSAASLVSPKDTPPNNHDSLNKSLAKTSRKSSTVLCDQMKILRHKLKKPESIDDSMTQNKKCTPIANPATTPSSSTSNASPDPSRLTSNTESTLSSSNSSANATPSSPTSQNQPEVPISGERLVPFDASRALVSKPNTVPQVTHQVCCDYLNFLEFLALLMSLIERFQRIAAVPQPVPGPFLNPFGQLFPMQGGQKMQVHSNFPMHPAHLPYPAVPGFMGHPGFVPPMMFPPHPQMFHPYHPMPAFPFFHPQIIPPPHMIVPSPVSDIFQPADEVLQYLLNDLKDKELLNRLRHVPEPLPEAFWIGLREDTTAKTRVIENMGSKLCGDFRNCAFMSQAKSEVIGKKHGVSGQVVFFCMQIGLPNV
ncbi:hypothetical protein B9Z55_026364 [Caenorhabditis nigoni]|uniref:Uncharacterized protein n=1 Tax=Caenorhabditis nigoni TaxID=1611254 RepID=A0A2G5T2R7_9PELO|nr:hypothetical protein B9Z55_026364 [Caenorhabditis nigoni]